VRVYDLLARSGASLSPEQEKAVAFHAAGLEAYREQRWDEAVDLFGQALAAWPEDGPSRTMAARCRKFTKAPPPGEWDGIFEQTLESLKGDG
jgi:adenylate cyclase